MKLAGRSILLLPISICWACNCLVRFPFLLVAVSSVSTLAFSANMGTEQPTTTLPASSSLSSHCSDTIDDDTAEFHRCAASAVDLSSGHVGTKVLSVIRSVRNWELNTRQKYLYRIRLDLDDDDDNNVSFPPIPLDSSVRVYLPSPSGKKTVVIKTETEQNNIIEVWQGSSLVRKIATSNKHGAIINDPDGFGIPSWSPNEEYLLYSAERPVPATTQFWTKTNNKKEQQDKEEVIRGGTYVVGQGRSEGWGETYSGQEPLLDLYIVHLWTGKSTRVVVENDVPEKTTLGQAVWHPDSSRIAFTAWSSCQPKRLGMVYCKNRSSKVYESRVEALLHELAADAGENTSGSSSSSQTTCVSSDEIFYARSPRYVGETLVFLASDCAFASHDACMGLYRWDETTQSSQTVVPVVETPSSEGTTKVHGLGFPGLFLGQLPFRCAIDEHTLVATTLWGSFQRIVRVNLQTGKVDLVHCPEWNELSSQSVCTVSPNGDLIVSQASCDQPAALWVVNHKDLVEKDWMVAVNAKRLPMFAPIAASSFSTVTDPFPQQPPPYGMHVFSIPSNEIDGAPSFPVQALLLLPRKHTETNKVPLVVVPHGGPHGCSASTFAPGIAYMASKYAVLLPNYRGSTGFGQASLSSLLTRIGRADVDDVMLGTKHAIETFSLEKTRVGICGGSHGGFLTAHCTSQYPEFFKAAAIRNPVTNIASMITSTDIPDWCFGEVMGEYDQSTFRGPTREQIEKMYDKSPVSRVHRVTTPTLVALGLVDLRVPPSQGLEWYHSLKSQGVPTKLLTYPDDCHSLNLVGTEADHWMHIRHWFDTYL